MDQLHSKENQDKKLQTIHDLDTLISDKSSLFPEQLTPNEIRHLSQALLLIAMTQPNDTRLNQTETDHVQFSKEVFVDALSRPLDTPQYTESITNKLLQTAVHAHIFIPNNDNGKINYEFENSSMKNDLAQLTDKIIIDNRETRIGHTHEYIQWNGEMGGIRSFDPASQEDIKRMNDIENDQGVIKEFGDPMSIEDQIDAAQNEPNERYVYMAVGTPKTHPYPEEQHEHGEIQGWIRFVKDRENVREQLQIQNIEKVTSQLREYFTAYPELGVSTDESIKNRLEFRKSILKSYENLGSDHLWETSAARSIDKVRAYMTSASNQATLDFLYQTNKNKKEGVYAVINHDNKNSIKVANYKHWKYIGDIYEYMDDEDIKEKGIMFFALDDDALKKDMLRKILSSNDLVNTS